MKAGRAAAGEFAAEKAIKQGKAALVILPGDASENTKKKFRNMAAWRKIPVRVFLTKEELGRAIGKAERSSLVITDRELARKIAEQIEEQEASKQER